MSNRLKSVAGKKEQWFASALVLLLVVVAIIGYSIKPAGAPLRVAFATDGGGVIFDHQMHAGLKDTKCSECHHNYDDNDKSSRPASCRDCHYTKEYAEICRDEPLHKRCIGKQCASCHVSGTVGCTFCHNAEHFVKPLPPEEVTFETDGGTVVFNHTLHATADGAELDCAECHHGYDPKKPFNISMNCRQCHYNTKYNTICEDQETHVRCIGKNCLDCHTDGADDCEICHK